jgi:hypothetical protein
MGDKEGNRVVSRVINMNVDHGLGEELAKERIDRVLKDLQAAYAAHLSYSDVSWTSRTATIRLGAIGQTVTAAVHVYDQSAEVNVELPLLLIAFSEKVRSIVLESAKRVLHVDPHVGPSARLAEPIPTEEQKLAAAPLAAAVVAKLAPAETDAKSLVVESMRVYKTILRRRER